MSASTYRLDVLLRNVYLNDIPRMLFHEHRNVINEGQLTVVGRID